MMISKLFFVSLAFLMVGGSSALAQSVADNCGESFDSIYPREDHEKKTVRLQPRDPHPNALGLHLIHPDEDAHLARNAPAEEMPRPFNSVDPDETHNALIANKLLTEEDDNDWVSNIEVPTSEMPHPDLRRRR